MHHTPPPLAPQTPPPLDFSDASSDLLAPRRPLGRLSVIFFLVWRSTPNGGVVPDFSMGSLCALGNRFLAPDLVAGRGDVPCFDSPTRAVPRSPDLNSPRLVPGRFLLSHGVMFPTCPWCRRRSRRTFRSCVKVWKLFSFIANGVIGIAWPMQESPTAYVGKERRADWVESR